MNWLYSKNANPQTHFPAQTNEMCLFELCKEWQGLEVVLFQMSLCFPAYLKTFWLWIVVGKLWLAEEEALIKEFMSVLNFLMNVLGTSY